MPKKSKSSKQKKEYDIIRAMSSLLQQSKKKKSGKSSRNKNKKSGKSINLSPCAAQYALAISNPWDPKAQGACIPKWPARPSQKVTTFQRVGINTGTQGWGWALISPCVANNGTIAWVTTSAYTGGALANFTANGTCSTTTPGVSGVLCANAPYIANAFTDAVDAGGFGLKARLVSIGVSIQYTGTISNMGGTYFLYSSGNHSNCFQMSVTDISSKIDAKVGRITNKKCWLTASAVSTEETEFEDKFLANSQYGQQMAQAFPFSQGQAIDSLSTNNNWYNGMCPMLLMFQSPPGNGFELEIIQHIEYTGGNSQSLQTPSHADSVGFEIVNTAAQTLTNSDGDLYTDIRSVLMSKIREAAGSLTGSAIRAGLNYLKANKYSSGGNNPYLLH